MDGEMATKQPKPQRTSRRRTVGHHRVMRGKKVIVYLQDGTKFVRKFKENTSKFLKFFDGPDIPASRIATITIYKPKQD